MLKNKTRTVVLGADSFIGEEQVLTLSATIPSTTGVGTTSQYIQNADLYNANKTAIRRDITAFQEDVWAVEDSMVTDEAITE